MEATLKNGMYDVTHKGELVARVKEKPTEAEIEEGNKVLAIRDKKREARADKVAAFRKKRMEEKRKAEQVIEPEKPETPTRPVPAENPKVEEAVPVEKAQPVTPTKTAVTNVK